MNTRRNKQ